MATTTPLEAFLEVMEDYNIIVHSLVSSAKDHGRESMSLSRHVDSEICFPELASSSTEFAIKFLGFMDVSCSLADAIIKALQSLTSQSLASTDIHPYDDVLHVIEDTMGACQEMRNADNEVLCKCMELPLETVKAALAERTNKSIEARRELQFFESYLASLSTRNALPIEDCLVRMKTWWGVNHYESLRSAGPLPPNTELRDRLISECEELIAQVGICARLWYKPLGQHLRIFSHPLFENVNKGMVEDEVLCGKNNHLVDMATWYIKSDHMSYEELNLVFDRDVLSAIVYFAEPLLTTSSHLFNEAIRSYAKILGLTYELLVLRYELDIHITWHIPAALLLKNLMEALDPVSDLHESLVNARDEATTEIEQFKNLTSQLKVVYPSHGNSLCPVTDETPEHLRCINCLIHNLIEHAACIEHKVAQHACYPSQSQSRLETAQPSQMPLLHLAEQLLSQGSVKEIMKIRLTILRDSTSSRISGLPQILEKFQLDSGFQHLLEHIKMLDLLRHKVDSLLLVPDRSIKKLMTSTTLCLPWFKLIPDSEDSLECSLDIRVLFHWRRCSNKEQIAFSRASAAAKRGESSKSKEDDLQKKSNHSSNTRSSIHQSFSGKWHF